MRSVSHSLSDVAFTGQNRHPDRCARQSNPIISSEYDRPGSRAAPLVDEIANELSTWPGVRLERRADGAALVRYPDVELCVLYRDGGVAELPVLGLEHDELIDSLARSSSSYGAASKPPQGGSSSALS